MLIFLCGFFLFGLLSGVGGAVLLFRLFGPMEKEKKKHVKEVEDLQELIRTLEEQLEKEKKKYEKELEELLDQRQALEEQLLLGQHAPLTPEQRPRVRRSLRLHVTANGECFHSGPCKSTQSAASVKLYRPCHYCCDVLD